MDHLKFWRSVEKTDPAHTKHVAQRGGFTAIDAYYQIRSATEQWGPLGDAWHYEVDLQLVPIGEQATWLARIALYTPLGEHHPVVQYGCKSAGASGRVDEDAPKKAVTDGLTKCLSLIGFNADVFLGRFDDNKYVEAMRKEFGGNGHIKPDEIIKLKTLAMQKLGLKAESWIMEAVAGVGCSHLPEITTEQGREIARLLKSLPDHDNGDGPCSDGQIDIARDLMARLKGGEAAGLAYEKMKVKKLGYEAITDIPHTVMHALLGELDMKLREKEAANA